MCQHSFKILFEKGNIRLWNQNHVKLNGKYYISLSNYFCIFDLSKMLYSPLDYLSFPAVLQNSSTIFLKYPIRILLQFCPSCSGVLQWKLYPRQMASTRHTGMALSCASMDKYGTWGKIKRETCFRHLSIEHLNTRQGVLGWAVLETRHFQRCWTLTGDKVLDNYWTMVIDNKAFRTELIVPRWKMSYATPSILWGMWCRMYGIKGVNINNTLLGTE